MNEGMGSSVHEVKYLNFPPQDEIEQSERDGVLPAAARLCRRRPPLARVESVVLKQPWSERGVDGPVVRPHVLPRQLPELPTEVG